MNPRIGEFGVFTQLSEREREVREREWRRTFGRNMTESWRPETERTRRSMAQGLPCQGRTTCALSSTMGSSRVSKEASSGPERARAPRQRHRRNPRVRVRVALGRESDSVGEVRESTTPRRLRATTRAGSAGDGEGTPATARATSLSQECGVGRAREREGRGWNGLTRPDRFDPVDPCGLTSGARGRGLVAN